MFAYTAADLNKSLAEFFGPGRPMEDFGLDSEKYTQCFEMDNDLFLKTCAAPTDEAARSYGFRDLEHFKDVLARCHIWNEYTSSQPDTVMRCMTWRFDKVSRYFPRHGLCAPAAEGDILEFLKKFKVEHFITIGW